MWKHINTARCVLRRGLQAILGIAAFAIISPAPSHAAVEYEKVCSLYGARFFYIPGTDTCANARQILDNQFAIARELTRAATGTAMATALVNPFLPEGTDYAISTHWAVFDGQHACRVRGIDAAPGQPGVNGGGRCRPRSRPPALRAEFGPGAIDHGGQAAVIEADGDPCR